MQIGYPQRSFPFWKSLDTVTDIVGKYRLKSKYRTDEEVGTND